MESGEWCDGAQNFAHRILALLTFYMQYATIEYIICKMIVHHTDDFTIRQIQTMRECLWNIMRTKYPIPTSRRLWII